MRNKTLLRAIIAVVVLATVAGASWHLSYQSYLWGVLIMVGTLAALVAAILLLRRWPEGWSVAFKERARPHVWSAAALLVVAGLMAAGAMKSRHDHDAEAAVQRRELAERQRIRAAEVEQARIEYENNLRVAAAERAAAAERFNKMTSAEHLAAARFAMDNGYYQETGGGGDYALAKQHLDAVSTDTPEHREAKALLGEIRTRQERYHRHEAKQQLEAAEGFFARGQLDQAVMYANRVYDDVPEKAKANRLLAKIEAQQKQAQAEADRVAAQIGIERRRAFASRLDRAFIQSGIEVRAVSCENRNCTTLRVVYVFCGRVFVDRHFNTPVMVRDLRAAGFTDVECRTGFGETTSLNL